jgi:hypothetical protein
MWKKIVIASAVAAVAGSSLVYAQRAGGPNGFGPDRRPGISRWQPSPEDMSAFLDARVAGMKAGLKLSPDQEKNWPAFETAYRDLAKLRMDRMKERHDAMQNRWQERQARRERRQEGKQGDDAQRDAQAATPNGGRGGNFAERMERRADAMTARAAAFKKYADALGPLYQSLDDGQKHRFAVLSHPLRARMRFAREEHGGFGRGDFGPMGPHRHGEMDFHGPRFGALEGPGMEHFAAAGRMPAEPELAPDDEDMPGGRAPAPDSAPTGR